MAAVSNWAAVFSYDMVAAPSDHDESWRSDDVRVERSGVEESAPRAASSSIATMVDGVPSDTIVGRIQSGDADALAALYLAFHDRLWRFGMTLLADADVAHELVQDVFASMWARRATLVVRDDVAVYLFGAARHLAQKVRRHAGVVRRLEPSAREASHPFIPESPDRTVERDDIYRAVHAALDTLVPRERGALLLRWREGRTYEEIGQILGVSPMGAHKMVVRALARIRPLLDQFRDPDEGAR